MSDVPMARSPDGNSHRPIAKLSAEKAIRYDALIAAEYSRQNRILLLSGVLIALVLVSAGFTGLFDGERLAGAPEAFAVLGSEMVPPDFTNVRDWIRPLIDTLAMSVAGTALAVVISVPLGFLAARNTTPNLVVYQAARLVLNVLRSIPELIMGILFVAAVGFGPLPGVLALGFHSVGMVGKFFAESIEHVDERPIEAAEAAGAHGFQIIQHAVFPQVLSQFADTTIYRWEYNFRASTVMGMVGAGGIGFELMSSLRLMSYSEVSAILITILIMVSLVDAIGSFLRRLLK